MGPEGLRELLHAQRGVRMGVQVFDGLAGDVSAQWRFARRVWRGLRACSNELSKVASHCEPDTTSGGWRWFNETLMALTAFSTE